MAILQREDIPCVIVAVPITETPRLCRMAWAAGKHVLSEKPVAPDSTQARDLIADYNMGSEAKRVDLACL